MKRKDVSRKGNTITVRCKNRKQTIWMLDRIGSALDLHSFFSGSPQWSKKEVANLLDEVNKKYGGQ